MLQDNQQTVTPVGKSQKTNWIFFIAFSALFLIFAFFLAPIIPRMGFYGLKHKAFSIIQDTLYNFYEAAGFSCEPLQAELDALKPEELIEAYLKL